MDASILRGKRIAIDPGHGGFFRGALGVDGLTEAEVNLGVALQLWGLLEGAGAEVALTRTDDRDFLSPADSTLRADLAERVRLAGSFDPDLFLSIHHNADARGLHTVNETQTYYKLGDEGPSLDLAQALHRRLVGQLGITPHRLQPGNYFVLRETEAPAALTEASYITHPEVERKLQLAAKQRLEAQALFLGLVDYFSTPGPAVEELAVLRGGGAEPAGQEGRPVLRARVAGSFDQVEIRVDGEPIPLWRDGAVVLARPAAPLAHGPHVAEVRARLLGGRSARPLRHEFGATWPVAALAIEVFPPAGGEPGTPLAVRVVPRDPFARAHPESLRVRITAALAAPAETVILARKEGWAYLRVGPHASRRRARGREPGIEVRAALLDTVAGAGHARQAEARVHLPGVEAGGTFTAFLRTLPDSAPLAGARLDSPPTGPASLRGLSPHGFFWSPADSAGLRAPLRIPGFRPVAGSGEPVPPLWSARFGGALLGRRIVIDPEGGGEDAAGVGPMGTRAATVNLESARILARLLEGAGARVRLTREGDFALSEVERVQVAERFTPDRVLRIGHGAGPPRLGYYFSSVPGRRWAEGTSRWLGAMGVADSVGPVEDAHYVLQQTSCPALHVSAIRMDEAGERRLLDPAVLRREAYALLVALAADLSPQSASWVVDELTLERASGGPADHAMVEIGGTIHVADAAGVVRFVRGEPGALDVAVHQDGRVAPVGVLLDSDRGSRFALPP